LKNGAKMILAQENIPFYPVAKETQLLNGAKVIHNIVASNHILHGTATRVGFFKEDQLHSGHKSNMYLNKLRSSAPLLPRQVAQQIPFSLENLKEAFDKLSVKPNSENAEIIETVIRMCEAPPMDGEEKTCATSLESMMDFVISKFGKNVRVVSTEVLQSETKPQNLVVKDAVSKLEDGEVISCHPLMYPYVVYWCHRVQKTSAYFVPLEGEDDGVRVKAVAVCHKDTSKWDPNHVAFKVIKDHPGTPVCHFFPEGHLVWFPNSQVDSS